MLFFVAAGLNIIVGVGLSASLRFPEVLLEDPSFAAPPGPGAVAALLGLVLCGAVQVKLAMDVGGGGRPAGVAAGVCQGGGGLLGLVLITLWGSGTTSGLPVVAFAAVALAAPALLAVWILLTTPRAGILAALGLLTVIARSMVWLVAPSLHVTGAVLTVLALLLGPMWIVWLIRMGLRPGRRWVTTVAAVSVAVLNFGAVTAVTPTPDTDRIPRVPSAAAASAYTMMLLLSKQLALPTTYPELLEARRAERYTRPEFPPGVVVEHVSAAGVPAEMLCAEGVSRARAVLYLHGGGFVLPVSNGHRRFAATLSRRVNACVLLPHYRLAPEFAFPAAVHDSVAAYRWLLERGIAAADIAIVGDSCGATFALATALSLRENGIEPPAALVALSPGTDLTLSGQTHRTNEHLDALLSHDDVAFSVSSYVAGADPRNPLVSPLFGDLAGFPPTMLLAGSQEVLLSDSVRMAERLEAAGVRVRLEVWPGMIHDWPVILEELMESRLAVSHVAAFLSDHLG